jgi:hypothetical protein
MPNTEESAPGGAEDEVVRIELTAEQRAQVAARTGLDIEAIGLVPYRRRGEPQVVRRAYEYDHQYGLTLYGRTAERRPAAPSQG